MSSPPFVRRMPLAAANTARSFPTATATVTAASYTQKTSTEVAVATAFPELVNMSDSSFFDHWNSVDFSQDYPDEEYSSRYLVSDSDDDNDMELQRHNRKKQPPVDLDISAAQSLLDNSIYTSPDIDPNIDNNIDDMEDPPTNRGRESASMTPTLRVIPVFARSKRRSVNHEPTNTRTPPTTASTTSTPTTGHATRNTHNYHNDTSTLTDWFTPYRRTDEDVEEPSNGIVVGGGGGAPRDCQNRLHPKQPTLYHNPPLLLAVWEKILIALVLIAVAFCLFVTIALIVHHTTGRGGRIQWILGGNHDAPPTTTNATTVTAQPSNINTTSSPKPDDIDTSNQERWETIRAWLPNSSSNAITTSTSSSTATGLGTFALNALSWLVHGDLPTILGPLPSHQEFEFFQAKQKSLQGANNDNIEMAFLTPYNISSDDEEQQQLYTYLESFSCHVTQRFALLVLFFAILESSGGVPLGGWASVTGARLHECLWPGVICLRDHDYLSALELDTSIGMLEGSLPTELGLLTHLGSYFFVRSSHLDT